MNWLRARIHRTRTLWHFLFCTGPRMRMYYGLGRCKWAECHTNKSDAWNTPEKWGRRA